MMDWRLLSGVPRCLGCDDDCSFTDSNGSETQRDEMPSTGDLLSRMVLSAVAQNATLIDLV